MEWATNGSIAVKGHGGEDEELSGSQGEEEIVLGNAAGN
jgi:hypothetical protein